MKNVLFLCFSFLLVWQAPAQQGLLWGKVTSKEQVPLKGVEIYIKETNSLEKTDKKGIYRFNDLPHGTYTLITFSSVYYNQKKEVEIGQDSTRKDFVLDSTDLYKLDEVEIAVQKKTFGIARLKEVEGTTINAGKKNEVVLVKDLTANKATNNSRQVFSRVAGLTIWESDGAGIQMGIGGRGLSPNRTSNFNVRQNGYDISADALGYPESYYTPPTEALERIEVIRGAASLQYGTQFGGLLNFKMKEGPPDKTLELTGRQTVGSYGLSNTFLSGGGTHNDLNYYAFYQYKRGNGWRENAEFDVHTAYTDIHYNISSKARIGFEYTFMHYLARQPGGLTDAQFETNPRASHRDRNWFMVNWNLFATHFDYNFTPNLRLNSRLFGLVASRDALGNLKPINRVDNPESNRDLISGAFNNIGNETRLIYEHKLFDNPSAFLIGTRLYRGTNDSKQGKASSGRDADFSFLSQDGLEDSEYYYPNTNIAVFAEDVFHPVKRLSVTPGIRFEYINTEAEGYYKKINKDLQGDVIQEDIIEEQNNKSRSFALLGIGFGYKLHQNMETYANFSQNYRAVNFSDIRINNPNLQIDPDIHDEQGYTTDLGIRGNKEGAYNFDVSLFHLSYQDRIGLYQKTVPDPQIISKVVNVRTNIADARIYGLEFFAEMDPFRVFSKKKLPFHLTFFANLSLIESFYLESEEANNIAGNQVEQVPPLNLKSGITFRKNDFTATAQIMYVEEHFTDATNANDDPRAVYGIIPSYYVTDLSLGYRYNKHYALEAGVNNLTNNHYFTRRATGYPGPGIIPAEGRNFYVTLELKY